MAYLRISHINGHCYYYIVRSQRTGTRVRSKVLEYLGRDPHPARLKKAMVYWGVKEKPGKGKRR
jgi:hypothetical protein